MARSATIKLDDTEYKVFSFDLGQIERFTDAIGTGDGVVSKERLGLFILGMALENAEPPVPDPKKVRASADDVMAAVPIILKLAGLQQTAANPQPAAEALQAAAA